MKMRGAVLAGVAAAAIWSAGLCAPAVAGEAPAASAEVSATKLELANRLLEATNAREAMLAQRKAYVAVMLADAAKQVRGDPATKAFSMQLAEKVVAEIMEKREAAALAQTAQLYAATYSEEELRAMIDFNESPMGRAIVEKGSTLTDEMVALSMQMWAGLPEEMRARTDELMKASKEKRR